MKKGIWMLLGFILLLLGASALILSFVGVQLSFLAWLNYFGALTGFVLKLLMFISGIVIMYMTATDWKSQV
jgi:hypothetical protein